MGDKAREEVLFGGLGNSGAVVRVGRTVVRPSGPQSTTVQRLLAHLRDCGFEGAPSPHGFDEQGREVLEFLDGDVPLPPVPSWAATTEAAASVGRLVRRLRDATSTFDPGPDAQWAHQPPPQYRGESIGHNDVCVENVVFRAGAAHALIDFDWASPSDPIWELASTARYWGPVEDPADARGGFRIGDPVARIRGLIDGFGASETQRTALIPAIRDFLDWSEAHVESQARAGHPGFQAAWESGFADRRERARRWLRMNADRINETLRCGIP